jgi:hypothetical protein
MATRKTPTKAAAKKQPEAQKRSAAPASMPKEGRDPKGGLTAKGREFFNKKEGSHLRPGVQGPADTPEKMVRKGSFLRRHFTHPRGPMKDDKGQPTRLALSAHAWGEPVPNTTGDAKKLAAKGHELLEEYHRVQEGTKAAGKQAGRSGKKSAGKTATKKTAASKGPATRSAARKTAVKKAPAKRTPAGKKSAAKRRS